MTTEKTESGVDDAYEREFWSTFGEGGVCVFWGIDGEAFDALPAPMRRDLVGYTASVAHAPHEERARSLAALKQLPPSGRLERLCLLANASASRNP